jgi:hypothetical protein
VLGLRRLLVASAVLRLLVGDSRCDGRAARGSDAPRASRSLPASPSTGSRSTALRLWDVVGTTQCQAPRPGGVRPSGRQGGSRESPQTQNQYIQICLCARPAGGVCVRGNVCVCVCVRGGFLRGLLSSCWFSGESLLVSPGFRRAFVRSTNRAAPRTPCLSGAAPQTPHVQMVPAALSAALTEARDQLRFCTQITPLSHVCYLSMSKKSC